MTWILATITFDAAFEITNVDLNLIAEDPRWPYCVNSTPGGANRPRPEIRYDEQTGALIVGINQSAWNLGPLAASKYFGSRVVIRQTFDRGVTWNPTWLGLCNPEFDPQTGQFFGFLAKLGDDPCLDPAYGVLSCWPNSEATIGGLADQTCYQYGLEMALAPTPSGRRRLGLAWHDNRDRYRSGITELSEQFSDIWGASLRTGHPFDLHPATANRVTPITPFSGVPWREGYYLYSSTAFGDYEGMAADPDGSVFWAFWADGRDTGDLPLDPLEPVRIRGQAFWGDF
jgi:hypothetical protein